MKTILLIEFLAVLAAAVMQNTAHAADVTTTWTNAASGNWNVNGNWTNAPALGGFPNNGNGGVATYDAVISATGAAYTVTNSTSITAEDLTISSANATLNHTAGIFTATNGIAVSAGTYQLNGGTISNTTINLSGTGNLNIANGGSGLLTGVTVNGAINVNSNGGRVKIANGTSFTTARVIGFSAGLGYAPGQTMSGTVLFEGGGSLLEMDGTSGTLTIGAVGEIRMTSSGGNSANIGGEILFPGGAMTLVNNGLITNQGSAITMTVVPASFTNAGTVEATSNGITTVNTANWSNTGTVRALTGGTVNLNGAWSGPSGTLTADATSSLHLGGTFSTPNIGTFSLATTSQVRVKGAWNNNGQSFSINTGAGVWTLDGGTITGGTLNIAAGQNLLIGQAPGNLLTGVTINGAINVSSNAARVKIANGTTFTTARVTGFSAGLGYAPGQTMNGTVLFEGGGSLLEMDGTSGTLTVGAAGEIRMTSSGGNSANIGGEILFPGGTMTLVNNGLITNQGSASTMTVVPASFTNAGTVEATSNGITTVNTANWSNMGTVRALTGGTVNLNGAWSGPSGTLTADATSSLHLGGTFSTPNIGTFSLATTSQVRVKGAWNNSGQSFAINAGAGVWTLDGGTITGGTLNIAAGQNLLIGPTAGSQLSGVTVNGAINVSSNAGRVKITNGTSFTTARVIGYAAGLGFAPGQTLNGSVLFEGGGSLVEMDGTSGTLTIGAAGEIRMTAPPGSLGNIGGAILFPGGDMTLVNNGLISNQSNGSTMTIASASFTNAGTLEVTSGGTTTISAASFTNAGIVEAASGGILSRPGGYTQSSGSTRVTGGTIRAQTAAVNDLIQLNGGALEGRGTIQANVLAAGSIDPASGSATGLIINGDLSLGTNVQLHFALGGTVQGLQYDYLSEAGSAPLTLDGVLRLTFAGGFQNTITGGNTFTIIASNATLTGAFDNVASGSRLFTDDGLGSFVVTITGNSVVLSGYLPVPDITVSGNNVNIADGDATPDLADHTDFASVNLSGGTRVRTFTITNSSQGVLTLGSVTVSGAHAADFTVTAQPTSPVVPGGNTTFQVTFDPNGVGLRSAALSLMTDDPDENPFNFSIQGTGALSNNADLSALTTSSGALVPAFNPALTSYTNPLSYYVTSVTVTATKADPNASIHVRLNGGSYVSVASGTPSAVLPLNVGANTVEVRVTAEDGSTKTSAIAVSRSAPMAGDSDLVDFNIVGLAGLVTAVQPDGKTIIAGFFTSVLGQPRNHIARLNADGTLDEGFNPNANDTVSCVEVLPDGKVLIGGSFTTMGGVARNYIARVNANGTLDTGFDPRANNTLSNVRAQADGKVLLAGNFTALQPNGAAAPITRNHFARVNANGTLDTAFDPNLNGYVECVTVQTDGRMVLAGDFTTIQPNGAAAPTTRNRIARMNADGTLDTGFDPNANGVVHSATVQSDGKVLLGGEFTTLRPNGASAAITRNHIARVNTDGTLDTGFDPNANDSVFSLALQADGRVLLAGGFTTLQPNGAVPTTRNRVARVNADGTLDAGFNPRANNGVYGVAVHADGTALIAGYFTTLQPNLAEAPVSMSHFARLVNDPATQSLTIPSLNRVQWLRGGASAETQEVSFELSLDGGTNYTPLGTGARISGGWELTGLALPPAGQIRARARISGAYRNGGSGLVESIAAYDPETMTMVVWRQYYFGSSANNGSGADTYDFDQDGLPNIVEFAFGLDPTQGSSVHLPQPQISGGNFTVSFPTPPGVRGITYGAEWSTTLRSANWRPITDTGTGAQHSFSVPIDGNSGVFMRFVITSP
jgi:uncharacterized delta-60 repeat protein